MNETKWLTGADGDAMLEYVTDGLSPRQWVLLAAAYVRKLWDLLPEGVLRQAVDFVEHAAHPLDPDVRTQWVNKINTDLPTAVSAAEAAQHEIVRLCDPDAAEMDRPILERPNQVAPAFPLFQGASRHAQNSITAIGEALGQAAEAVRALFAPPTDEMLERVRGFVEQASETRTNANLAANRALRMKTRGDEIADEAASAKNKRLMESIAIEEVRKIEEGPRQRSELAEFEAEDKRERASRKQLGMFLREVVGNPFTLPNSEFKDAWRTTIAVNIAKGIYEERAFDRMPILADALLDADCDSEAVLRHCRGTEKTAKDGPVVHIRGCWVIELILGRYEPPGKPQGDKPAKRKKRNFDDFDIGLPFDLGEDRLA
jgi:hypothetical protein